MNTASGVLHNFISRSWLLLFARATQIGAVFFVFWFYSIRLTKDVYGTYQKVTVLISFCAALLGLGLPLLISSLPGAQLGRTVLLIWKKTRWIYGGCFAAVAIFLCSALPFLPFSVRLLSLGLSLISTGYIVLEILCIKRGNDTTIFGANLVYTILFAAVHLWIVLRPVFCLALLLCCLIILGVCRLCFAIAVYRRSGEDAPVPATAVVASGTAAPAPATQVAGAPGVAAAAALAPRRGHAAGVYPPMVFPERE